MSERIRSVGLDVCNETIAVAVAELDGSVVRDLVRARDDAGTDSLRAKHHLSKFLLRQGIMAPARVRRAWSRKYQSVAQHRDLRQITFDDYFACVRAAIERVRRLDAALLESCAGDPHVEVLRALQAVRGIGFLTAVTIVAEAGDLRRFRSAAATDADPTRSPDQPRHAGGGVTEVPDEHSVRRDAVVGCPSRGRRRISYTFFPGAIGIFGSGAAGHRPNLR